MTYSLDFRRRVMNLKETRGLSFQQTSDLFGISMRSLFRWSDRLEPCTTRSSYIQKLDPVALARDVEEYPDSYQKERAARLGVSESAIKVGLKKLGITRKKKPHTS